MNRPPRWRIWWADLRSLAGPVLLFWGAIGLGIVLCVVLLLYATDWDASVAWVFSGLVAATVLGTGLGQLCAVARIRTWVVVALGAALYAALTTAFTMFALQESSSITTILFSVGLFLPFFAVAGLLSLRTSMMSVFALFTPLTWNVAAILFAAEEIGTGADRWFAGQKYAVWDVLTAPILVAAIGLSVGYLALRERHRLRRWMTAPSAGDAPTVRRVSGSPLGAAATGCGSLITVALLVLVVSFGTGLVAPYLWRSAPADPDDPPSDHPPPPRKVHGKDTDHDGVPDRSDPGVTPASRDGARQVEEVARQVGMSLMYLMLLVLLSLVGALVFGPPVRRLLVLQTLRRPPPMTPPSERVAYAWRLCEVALADAGVEQFPSDSATAVVARIRPTLPPGLNLESLEEVAAIADRARFGYGLDPQDELRARRNAEMAYEAVWQVLSEWDRVRAVFRWSL